MEKPSVSQDDKALPDLHSITDFVRWGASRFTAAGLHFGHGTDNPIDEALVLVRHALHLGHDLPREFYAARLTDNEKRTVLDLLRRRITERVPAPYLTGEAWFAGLPFFVDRRVLIPRSPIAELIEAGFAPWLDAARVEDVLDLCAGSGCIAVACAFAFAAARVDAVELSAEALEVARCNVERHGVGDLVTLLEGDLWAPVAGRRYDLIVSNPPYVSDAEMAALPPEYGHEPDLGLRSGGEGLDVVARILAGARDHLRPGGVLVVEVGSAAEAVQAAWPELPFTWPEFARGGSGVFLLTAEELS
ncbi:MAG TPA: 50S ribosomal protein L3 N(5)-glutamine methyltransferase [Gammaproteobacteria bacterium]|nr:50S ribosomal protein L3 N(5)-glutamine methyltransferase [Gammaproteobacteria bacterium]